MNLSHLARTAEVDRLLERTALGDQRAFEALYRLTAPLLLSIAQPMLGDRGEAEDVVQETFVAVWHCAAQFDATRANARVWLTTLLRNRAITRMRRRRLERRHALICEPLEDPWALVFEAERRDLYERLQGCLRQLPPEQQDPLRAAFFTDVTHEELARRCSVPLGTLKSRIRRGLQRLRKEMMHPNASLKRIK